MIFCAMYCHGITPGSVQATGVGVRCGRCPRGFPHHVEGARGDVILRRGLADRPGMWVLFVMRHKWL